MIITFTSSDLNTDPECWDSFEALEEQLWDEADDHYTEAVLAALRAGTSPFRIANGPDTDTYTLVADLSFCVS